MGVLDDAIREHLELQRRRGADPTEVARLESEALGPARRGPEPLEPDAAPESVAVDEQVADPVLAQPEVDAPVHEDAAASPEPVAFEQATQVLPPQDPPAPAPAVADEPDPVAEDLPWESGAAEYDEDAPRSAQVAQETVAFDPTEVEEAHGEESEPPPAPEPEAEEPAAQSRGDDADADAEDGEDVLEETPEFLQETPEHDRLWFEQRPPRDFDFDG